MVKYFGSRAVDGKRFVESNATSIPGYVDFPRIEEAFYSRNFGSCSACFFFMGKKSFYGHIFILIPIIFINEHWNKIKAIEEYRSKTLLPTVWKDPILWINFLYIITKICNIEVCLLKYYFKPHLTYKWRYIDKQSSIN